MLEIIGGLAAIVTIIGVIYQFSVQPAQNLNDQKIVLIALYDTSRKLIDNLISDLEKYCTQYGQDKQYNATMTIGQYLRYLKDIRENQLSDELKKKVIELQLTTFIIDEMRISLQRQIHSFNESQAYLDSRFKY